MNSLGAHVKMEADGSMDVSAKMFRLFMQDCQMKDKDSPLLDPEFQYLICNPKLELAENKDNKELGQLSIKYVTNAKEASQDIDIIFEDFRITLVFPTVKGLLIFLNKLQKFGDQVMAKLNKLQSLVSKEDVQEIKEIAKEAIPKSTKPTKGKLNVIAKIPNFQLWLPMNPMAKDTEVTKYALSADAKYLNEVSEDGAVSQLVEATLSGLSIIFARSDNFDTILHELDIKLRYAENVGIDRDIFVEVKPII